MSYSKEQRHQKQEDRDEVKQYRVRRDKYAEEEVLDGIEENELSGDIQDWLHRHMK